MKLLLVGDPHCTLSELNECNRLLQFIFSLCIENKPDFLVFLGDQFDNHSIVRIEVMKFWYDWLVKFKENNIQTFLLKGNHDESGLKQDSSNSLIPFYSISNVIDEPSWHYGLLFLPYTHSDKQFIEWANKYNETNVIICHQTFQGAMYDNGIYAPEGVDPNLVPQKTIISGHIHSSHKFGKVWYPGSPRWRNLNDANKSKAVYLVDFNANYDIINTQSFDTSVVCTPIYRLIDKESEPLEKTPEKGDVRIEIHGTWDYIEHRKAIYRSKNYKISTYPIQQVIETIRESEGVENSLKKWFDTYNPQFGTDKNIIKEYLIGKGIA